LITCPAATIKVHLSISMSRSDFSKLSKPNPPSMCYLACEYNVNEKAVRKFVWDEVKSTTISNAGGKQK